MNKTEMDPSELEDILNPANRSVIRTEQFGIDGMTGEEWAEKIRETMSHVDGVHSIHVDTEKHVAVVAYDSRRTNMPELHDALLQTGYKPTRTAA